jgi:hypothetical protein
MANEILQKQGTSLTWKTSGGTYTYTLTSLANAASRKGPVHDFGATFPVRARWQLKTDFNAAPTAGALMYIYWVSSMDGSVFDAQLTSGDAAGPALAQAAHLTMIGSFVCENTTTSQIQSGTFEIPARYGFPVIYNASGQALSGTAGDHEFKITPLIDELQ